MKFTIFLTTLLSATGLFAQSNYSDSLRKVRHEHDSTFLETVLNSAERKNMLSLAYFVPDKAYIIPAKFTRVKGKKFAMPMTRVRDKVVYYRKYGKLTFIVEDSVCELFVYENLDLKGRKEFKGYLFMPFRDLTSGIDSYGGGRFIDLRKPEDDNWVIDFNTAYHPYCAYSQRYSCPVTPKENKLPVYISAGESLRGVETDH